MLWTKGQLKQLVEEKLKDNLFIVASNREPYLHKYSPDGIKWVMPAGGVTMALDPVLQACGGVWVAHGSGEADREVADEKNRVPVPPENPKYILRRVWLNKAEESGYYYGFSNETLWPLCHIVYAKPKFDEADWLHYKAVNEKFAKAILDEIGNKQAFVFLQDYHLTLVPQMLKEARPDIKVALFWHIPWPNPEVFRINPWKVEIVKGMLGADLLGFHIKYHAENFLETINQTIEARVDKVASQVVFGGREILVKSFPISVDYEEISRQAGESWVAEDAQRLKKEYDLRTQLVGVGIDRIDYTKGILERFKALDKFFEKYPEYLGKFTFLQAGVLSRIHLQPYKDLNDEINALVEKINWRHGTDGWLPIIMLRRQFNQKDLLGLYRLADLLIVSSLHDGMNLVAKEFVAAADPIKGVLVLSEFTGAAKELPDAVLINPYAPDSFAEALKTALELPADERIRRMERMKLMVEENNIYTWAAKIIQSLLRLF